jgi:hypothetical protein
VTVSFFNELDIGKRTMLRAPGSIPRLLFHFLTILPQREKLCSKILFHFLTSFPQRRETVLVTSVSFFNELATEKRKLCSIPLFHFLTSLSQRRKTMLMASVSFFNDLSTEKRNCACGLFLIMASKRITLW